MRKIKNLIGLGSALVLTFSTLLTIGFAGTAFAAAPYTCTWTGTTNNNFNTAGNWSGCNSAAPQPGDNDNLVFNSTTLGANTTLTNNITGLALTSITFSGSNSGGNNYTIAGNAISLSGGIIVGSSDGPTIDTNLTLTASQSITGGGAIFFGDSSTAPTLNASTYTLTIGSGSDNSALDDIYGTISGSGSLIAQSGSQLTLGGANSGWTGAISAVGSGTISFEPGGAGTASSVTIPNGANLFLDGFNGANFASNLTVGGTAAIYVRGGFHDPGDSYTTTANVNLTGTVTLTANTTIDTDGQTTISGPLSGAYTLGMAGGAVGQLIINSSNNTSQTANGNQAAPQQTITVASSDSQPTLAVTVGTNQTYIIDGVRGDTIVENGGILKGDGTVGALSVDKGGIVAPGHSPGCLTANGNLYGGGTYQAEIGGTTACSGYDQLIVTSGNTATLDDGNVPATQGILDVSFVNGFIPKAGQTFEIINNQGNQAVSDTFAGLANGATFTVSGVTFKISYTGGDGNDVVLTALTVPGAPDTGSALTKAYVALPLIGSIAIASGLYLTSKKNLKLPNIKLK